MSDRTDSQIRAFVVELLDHPVEPPAFPTIESMPLAPVSRRPGWAVALASFVIVLLVGVATILTIQGDEQPPVGASEVVANLTAAVNAGDAEATLSWFSPEAQCVAPGLPTCADLFEFFVQADATLSLSECATVVTPYLQCQGYVHTAVHDALGITVADLEATPNFPPAFIIEGGLIRQLNFSSPFTGDPDLDDRLWTFLLEIAADFVNDAGVPRFSADIVAPFIEAANRFAASDS